MSFPRYANYRDSEVERLGHIPKHWSVMKLRRCTKEHRQGYYSSDSYVDDGVKLLRITDLLESGRVDYSDCPRVRYSEDLHSFLLAEGDFVFARTGGAGTFGLISQLSEPMLYASYLIRFRFADTVNRQFLKFVFLTPEFQAGIDANIHGGVNKNVHAEDIKDQFVALPSLLEQIAIGHFLDRETAKIDALVAEQQLLIKVLKDKRQAVISHAVTKGLDPTAPMKHSGIEWLGDVPEHWSIMPLKRDLLFLTSGSRGWADHYSDDGPLFIRIGNLTRDGIDLDLSDVQRVAIPDGAEGERTRVARGDVLFSITAYLGSVAVVPEQMETAYVSQHVALARLRGKYLLPKWVAYLTLSDTGRAYLATQGYGGTKIQLSLDDVANLVVTVPSVMEQANVVSFLDHEIGKIDALIVEAKTAIALLRERCAALVSAAVTGKIDVRGLVEDSELIPDVVAA